MEKNWYIHEKDKLEWEVTYNRALSTLWVLWQWMYSQTILIHNVVDSIYVQYVVYMWLQQWDLIVLRHYKHWWADIPFDVTKMAQQQTSVY